METSYSSSHKVAPEDSLSTTAGLVSLPRSDESATTGGVKETRIAVPGSVKKAKQKGRKDGAKTVLRRKKKYKAALDSAMMTARYYYKEEPEAIFTCTSCTTAVAILVFLVYFSMCETTRLCDITEFDAKGAHITGSSMDAFKYQYVGEGSGYTTPPPKEDGSERWKESVALLRNLQFGAGEWKGMANRNTESPFSVNKSWKQDALTANNFVVHKTVVELACNDNRKRPSKYYMQCIDGVFADIDEFRCITTEEAKVAYQQELITQKHFEILKKSMAGRLSFVPDFQSRSWASNAKAAACRIDQPYLAQTCTKVVEIFTIPGPTEEHDCRNIWINCERLYPRLRGFDHGDHEVYGPKTCSIWCIPDQGGEVFLHNVYENESTEDERMALVRYNEHEKRAVENGLAMSESLFFGWLRKFQATMDNTATGLGTCAIHETRSKMLRGHEGYEDDFQRYYDSAEKCLEILGSCVEEDNGEYYLFNVETFELDYDKKTKRKERENCFHKYPFYVKADGTRIIHWDPAIPGTSGEKCSAGGRWVLQDTDNLKGVIQCDVLARQRSFDGVSGPVWRNSPLAAWKEQKKEAELFAQALAKDPELLRDPELQAKIESPAWRGHQVPAGVKEATIVASYEAAQKLPWDLKFNMGDRKFCTNEVKEVFGRMKLYSTFTSTTTPADLEVFNAIQRDTMGYKPSGDAELAMTKQMRLESCVCSRRYCNNRGNAKVATSPHEAAFGLKVFTKCVCECDKEEYFGERCEYSRCVAKHGYELSGQPNKDTGFCREGKYFVPGKMCTPSCAYNYKPRFPGRYVCLASGQFEYYDDMYTYRKGIKESKSREYRESAAHMRKKLEKDELDRARRIGDWMEVERIEQIQEDRRNGIVQDVDWEKNDCETERHRCVPPRLKNTSEVLTVCKEIALKKRANRLSPLQQSTLLEGEICTPFCDEGYKPSRDGRPIGCSQDGWVDTKLNRVAQLWEPQYDQWLSTEKNAPFVCLKQCFIETQKVQAIENTVENLPCKEMSDNKRNYLLDGELCTPNCIPSGKEYTSTVVLNFRMPTTTDKQVLKVWRRIKCETSGQIMPQQMYHCDVRHREKNKQEKEDTEGLEKLLEEQAQADLLAKAKAAGDYTGTVIVRPFDPNRDPDAGEKHIAVIDKAVQQQLDGSDKLKGKYNFQECLDLEFATAEKKRSCQLDFPVKKECFVVGTVPNGMSPPCKESALPNFVGTCTVQCFPGYIPTAPKLICEDGVMYPARYECVHDYKTVCSVMDSNSGAVTVTTLSVVSLIFLFFSLWKSCVRMLYGKEVSTTGDERPVNRWAQANGLVDMAFFRKQQERERLADKKRKETLKQQIALVKEGKLNISELNRNTTDAERRMIDRIYDVHVPVRDLSKQALHDKRTGKFRRDVTGTTVDFVKSFLMPKKSRRDKLNRDSNLGVYFNTLGFRKEKEKKSFAAGIEDIKRKKMRAVERMKEDTFAEPGIERGEHDNTEVLKKRKQLQEEGGVILYVGKKKRKERELMAQFTGNELEREVLDIFEQEKKKEEEERLRNERKWYMVVWWKEKQGKWLENYNNNKLVEKILFWRREKIADIAQDCADKSDRSRSTVTTPATRTPRGAVTPNLAGGTATPTPHGSAGGVTPRSTRSRSVGAATPRSGTATPGVLAKRSKEGSTAGKKRRSVTPLSMTPRSVRSTRTPEFKEEDLAQDARVFDVDAIRAMAEASECSSSADKALEGKAAAAADAAQTGEVVKHEDSLPGEGQLVMWPEVLEQEKSEGEEPSSNFDDIPLFCPCEHQMRKHAVPWTADGTSSVKCDGCGARVVSEGPFSQEVFYVCGGGRGYKGEKLASNTRCVYELCHVCAFKRMQGKPLRFSDEHFLSRGKELTPAELKRQQRAKRREMRGGGPNTEVSVQYVAR